MFAFQLIHESEDFSEFIVRPLYTENVVIMIQRSNIQFVFARKYNSVSSTYCNIYEKNLSIFKPPL